MPQMVIPRSFRSDTKYLRSFRDDNPKVVDTQSNDILDSLIYFTSLFFREFLSTMCLLVLISRLGGDLFIAGPVVTLYVCIVFRRPLVNPYVLTLACMSASDWKKANVAGYPGFGGRTSWWQLLLFWLLMITAELSGACAAAGIRAHNDRVLGYEFINGAAWGGGSINLRADITDSKTCWNKTYFPESTKMTNISMRINSDMVNDSCSTSIKWFWWVAEDIIAVLFIITTYTHVWRLLRWDDMKKSNPSDKEYRYWEKIVTFSLATSTIGLMTSFTFPTAHAGLHTSVFLAVYQSLNSDKISTALSMGEPYYRMFGGICGCLLGVVYEWALAFVENKGSVRSFWAELIHKVLYIGPIPDNYVDDG